MISLGSIPIAPNWTSAAGALEGILAFLGAPLPRHAIMGLSGHAWHTCLASHEGVAALPSGPSDITPAWRAAAYRRLGFTWDCFSRDVSAEARTKAARWATDRLAEGRPLLGWDFHVREYGIVYGFDPARQSFLVSDLLSPDLGPLVAVADWPSAGSRIELLAPGEPLDEDPLEVIEEALAAALEAFAGRDGALDGQPRGTRALTAWADAFDSAIEVDRAGNAYTLAVLAAARSDGAAFLADLADSIPALVAPLAKAAGSLRAQAAALAPLLTLFPFPSGGHGNVGNPGLRRAASHALRRAAAHETDAAQAIAEAVAALQAGR